MFYTGGNPWNSAYLEAVLFTKTFTCNTTSFQTLTISATKDLNSNLIPQILNIECIKIK